MVKAANMKPINFKARLSAIAMRPSDGGHKSPAGVRLGPFLPLAISLVNSVNQIIADAADNDHGRDGPEQKNWHVRFLLIGCPHPSNAGLLPLVPDVVSFPVADAYRKPPKRRIHKSSCGQARYRSRFCRPLPKWFQQNAVLVKGTACLKIDCSCAASLYWRQGNWKWTARASAGAL